MTQQTMSQFWFDDDFRAAAAASLTTHTAVGFIKTNYRKYPSNPTSSRSGTYDNNPNPDPDPDPNPNPNIYRRHLTIAFAT